MDSHRTLTCLLDQNGSPRQQSAEADLAMKAAVAKAQREIRAAFTGSQKVTARLKAS